MALNGLDADCAVGDHHEPDAALAADHDLVTGRMLDDLELLLDRPHLRFRQTLEKLRLFDFDHDRILCALSRPPQGPTRTVPDPRFGEGLRLVEGSAVEDDLSRPLIEGDGPVGARAWITRCAAIRPPRAVPGDRVLGDRVVVDGVVDIDDDLFRLRVPGRVTESLGCRGWRSLLCPRRPVPDPCV